MWHNCQICLSVVMTLLWTFFTIFPQILCATLSSTSENTYIECVELCAQLQGNSQFFRWWIREKVILCLGKYGIPLFPIGTTGDGDIFIILCQDVYCANARCMLKNNVKYYIKVSKICNNWYNRADFSVFNLIKLSVHQRSTLEYIIAQFSLQMILIYQYICLHVYISVTLIMCINLTFI